MNLFKIAFLQNPLSWLYFVAGGAIALLAQPEQGAHSAVVGVFIFAFMVEVIRFLKVRNDFIDADHRKLYLMKAVGNFFAALFGAIIAVLVI